MKIVNDRKEYLQEVSKLIPQNPICIEIGVLFGDFSQQILDILKPQKLYLVDSWEENAHDKNGDETYGKDLNFLPTSYSSYQDYLSLKNKYSQQIEKNEINIIRNYSYDAVSLFQDSYFDFIYIDACHLYECVKEDLSNYLPKLKQGGIMCGHDYFKLDNFGVIEAVDEFCEKNNYEMVILNNSEGCDWALIKKLL